MRWFFPLLMHSANGRTWLYLERVLSLYSQSMKHLLLCLMLLSGFSVKAQLDNSAFDQKLSLSPQDSSRLYAGIRLLAFGKNNEYFETTYSGYTLFGYQLNPFVYYQVGSKVRLDVGAYLQQDFGNDRLSVFVPTLSLKFKHRDFSATIGTIEGSLHHQLVEPLYDFENVLNKRIENGLQFLVERDGLFVDAWVNWEKMIYFNDPDQERFVAGLSLNKKVLNKNHWSLSIPIQATVRHAGGQIDNNPQPLTSVFASASGFIINKNVSGIIKAYGLKSYFLTYKSLTSRIVPYKDGNGIYINPYVQTNFGLSVMGSYWYGNEFLTSDGGQMYPVTTERYPYLVQPTRILYMLRFLYEKKLAPGLTLIARVEPIYDTYTNNIQYAYGFYFNFTDRFFLGHAKEK